MIESYLMVIFSEYCYDELALGFFIKTYHITSIVFARVDQEWLRRAAVRCGQKESGKMSRV